MTNLPLTDIFWDSFKTDKANKVIQLDFTLCRGHSEAEIKFWLGNHPLESAAIAEFQKALRCLSAILSDAADAPERIFQYPRPSKT
jgi:hypothetical protein